MRTTVVLAALLSTAALSAQEPSFTEAEIRAILAHGPWPTPMTTDPSNRVSGPEDHGRCH